MVDVVKHLGSEFKPQCFLPHPKKVKNKLGMLVHSCFLSYMESVDRKIVVQV
jgi:hypothetical protein